MIQNLVMLMVNIHELDTEQEIVLCKRNVPVAVIRPVAVSAGRRVIGLEKGRLQVPVELEALYNGEPG